MLKSVYGKEHMKVPFMMQETNIYKLVIEWGQYLACSPMVNARDITELFSPARVRPDEIHFVNHQCLLEKPYCTLISANAINQLFTDYKGATLAWCLTF